MDSKPLIPGDQDVEISISRGEEIRYWCSRLGCTAVQLGNAIGQVGYSAERVRALLEAGGDLPKKTWPP